MAQKLLIKILYAAILVAFFHYIALKFYFYWTVPGYDIPMHIAGGALMSFCTLWFIFFSGIFSIKVSARNVFPFALGATIVIGILWEVFEVRAGLTSLTLADRIDTVKDILDDAIGALLASWYFVKTFSKHNVSN